MNFIKSLIKKYKLKKLLAELDVLNEKYFASVDYNWKEKGWTEYANIWDKKNYRSSSESTFVSLKKGISLALKNNEKKYKKIFLVGVPKTDSDKIKKCVELLDPAVIIWDDSELFILKNLLKVDGIYNEESLDKRYQLEYQPKKLGAPIIIRERTMDMYDESREGLWIGFHWAFTIARDKKLVFSAEGSSRSATWNLALYLNNLLGKKV